jgi:hypothetical protein
MAFLGISDETWSGLNKAGEVLYGCAATGLATYSSLGPAAAVFPTVGASAFAAGCIGGGFAAHYGLDLGI